MAYNLKKELSKPERFVGGHRLCAGCGAGIACRGFCAPWIRGQGSHLQLPPAVWRSLVSLPYTAWEDSYIHSAFENAAATASGAEAAYRVLRKKGKVQDNFKFITIGGDGGTYDIGFQSLSGAMERNHDMVYFCYDNEAYMNTGIQRSSATPRYANATTTPIGAESTGKTQNKKDLTAILAAHEIPYAAQTTFIGNFKDFHEKARKAIYTPGACFVNILAPCPRGWQYPAEDLAIICKMAVETCVWPLYEVENGQWRLNYKPKNKLPVEEFMRLQGRFKHCFKPGNEDLIVQAQKYVDDKWEALLNRCNA